MEMYIKRQATATAEEEDRISDLPDCIIHHILSFLPSTKQGIRTSILSKRWLNQWTHVPVIIFDDSKDISPENFLDFVDNTLSRHDYSKVKKFHLKYPDCVDNDPQFDSKILFATRKHVEELYLSCYWKKLLLPEFLFNTGPSSLVKLTAINCTFMPDRKVSWGCLTTLHMRSCKLNDQALQQILSGSPSLESFELINYLYFDKFVIASKSLKKLVLGHDHRHGTISAIEISCPNLLELSLVGVEVEGDANLFGQAFANFLSTTPLLESLKLIRINCPLVIASKSLKRLVLVLSNNILNLHVSCPQLELLVLFGHPKLRTTKLLDLPSSLCATFDFYHYNYDVNKNSISKNLVKDILQQLHHVKQLTIGNQFIKILSTFGVGDPFPFVLNVKSLTLNTTNLNKHYSAGIARLLRHAPELEKLVINTPIYNQAMLKLDDFGENVIWNPDEADFNCLVSHLKIVKVIGFPRRQDERMVLMSLVQFLLKNAKVLKKMIFITKDGTNVSLTISHKLLNLPRCSKHAIVELL